MAVATPRLSAFNHSFVGCSPISGYDILSKLGEGTFGEVHKARSVSSGKIVALKKILMHNEKDGFPVTAIREIKLLKMLSHTNVLQLDEMAVERLYTGPKDPRKKAIMYMVTPYMEHDLSGLLSNQDVKFTEPQIKCYMLQLLEGLKYLHNSQILHRDMKAANLLISNKGILQIADFGLARHYDETPPSGVGHGYVDAKREYTALVVTRWYRPPELLLGLRRYTPAIDLWGVGCVFGEMFKRTPILQGGSDVAQIQMIFDLVGSPTEETMPGWSGLPGCEGVKEFDTSSSKINQKFRELSAPACSLLSDLLKLNWRKRITAMSALQHPYFRAHPAPALPHELPLFEDSHELDHRKSRGQKGPPPAPAGGSVGMGLPGAGGGEWAAGGSAAGPYPDALSSQDRSRQGIRDHYRPRDGDYDAGRGNGSSQSRPTNRRDAALQPLHNRSSGNPSSLKPGPKDTYIPVYNDRYHRGAREDSQQDREGHLDRDTSRREYREREPGRDWTRDYDWRDRSMSYRERHDRNTTYRSGPQNSYGDHGSEVAYDEGRTHSIRDTNDRIYRERNRRATTRSRSPERNRWLSRGSMDPYARR